MGLHVTSTTTKTKTSVPLVTSNTLISSPKIKKIRNLDCNRDDYKREEQKLPIELPNVSVYNNMAPALNEPLSQTNKLSSSATSVSPHPTSNNYLINNNHTIENNNTTSDSSVGDDTVILSPIRTSNGKDITKEVNHKGTFQLTFERVVAKQAAAAAREKFVEDNEELSKEDTPNGTCSNNQMGSMCDPNSSTVRVTTTTNLKSSNNLDNQEQEDSEGGGDGGGGGGGSEEREDIKIEESKNIEEKDKIKEEQQQHMDLQDCENTDDCTQNQDQLEVGYTEWDTSNTTDATTITAFSGPNSNSLNTSLEVNTSGMEDEPSFEEENQHHEKINEVIVIEDDVREIKKKNDVHEEKNSLKSKDVARKVLSETVGPSSSLQFQQQQQQQQQQQHANVQQLHTIRTTSLTPATVTLTTTTTLTTTVATLTSTTPSLASTASLTSQNSGMSLQKDFIKESNEMDQVLGDMDLLQVLKGFDANPSSESLCDLAGSLVFFNDVDVMNYEEMGSTSEVREIHVEIEKKQQQMQRKCDFLLRRLRKLQSRYMAKHASEEIAGLFEWTHRVVRRHDLETNRQMSYEEDKSRSVSTASIMRAFLKRIDAVATAQHSNPAKRSKIVRNPSNLGTSDTNKSTIVPVIPHLDENVSEEIGHVSGMLQTELKQVQKSLDSDVTASSSGGESADEMVTYNNQIQQPLSIAKRAAWSWAHDRAAIASRWTWLLAQISDLEYRIKQHQDLYNQIKKNKGPIAHEKINPLSMQTDSVNNSSNTSTDITSTTLPSSVNGYRGVLPGNSKTMDTDTIPPNGVYDDAATNLLGSCRTRTFYRAGFRKRRLLQTANIHTISKKAARPSTVKCGCQWPLHPCALCTGRPDPTAPRDLPDTMTPSERVALLDPGFHPVLSFPEDISHSNHIEAVTRLSEWQRRVLRCSSKTLLKGTAAAQKTVERNDRSKKYADSRRKHNRKYSTAQDIMAANKLKIAKNRRSALDGRQYNNHLIKNNKQQHHHHQQRKLMSTLNAGGVIIRKSGYGFGNNVDLSINPGNNGIITGNVITTLNNATSHGGISSNGSYIMDNATPNRCGNHNFQNSNGLLPRSKNSSPMLANYSSPSYKSERMDRRNRNSYDIDNIVIPYRVAAATRVEILPYKEIPTPKWRIIPDEMENDSNSKEIKKTSGIYYIKTENNDNESIKALTISNDGNEIEDISDEAIQIRHERALLEEQKKFRTYLKFPWSTRSRANRRADSRTESSGANTPDPTSPNTPNIGGDQETISPHGSISAVQSPLEHMNGVEGITTNVQNSGIILNNRLPNNITNSVIRKYERKRKISWKKERENRDEQRGCTTPDPKEIIPPFEPLQFPLSDELYEAMLQMMPNDHQLTEDCLQMNACDGSNSRLEGSNDKIVGANTIKDGRYTGRYNTPSFSSSNASYRGDSDTLAHELTTFETGDSLIGEDSDTDSAESGSQDDPNDPEWREPA